MQIKHKNILLRTALKSDIVTLMNWWNDGSVMSHAGFPKGLNVNEKDVENSISYTNMIGHLFIIEINNIPVGELNYKLIDKNAEIGIKICDKSYQEKSYGTTILKMLINYLFTDLKIEKILIDTMSDNKRSQHVYTEKLGAKIIKNSKKDNIVYLELLKSDFYEKYK